MKLLHFFIIGFLISSGTFSMQEPPRKRDQKYSMQIVSLFPNSTTSGCRNMQEDEVKRMDFDSSNFPGPRFRFEHTAHVNLELNGNHYVYVENLSAPQYVPRRLCYPTCRLKSTQGQQQESQVDPASIVVEAGMHFYNAKGYGFQLKNNRSLATHELDGLPKSFLDSEEFQKQFEDLPHSFYVASDHIQNKFADYEMNNQCPMTRWSLEGRVFDVVISEREGEGIHAQRDCATIVMKGQSHIALARNGTITLKQTSDSNLVLHVPMGTFDELRGWWASQMPMRPHHDSYVTQSKVSLGLKSDGSTLFLDQQIYLPNLEGIHPNHPRLREGLVVSTTLGAKQRDVEQQITIGKGVGLQVTQGNETTNSYGLKLQSCLYPPAEIPQLLKDKIFPVIGTWGYYCNDKTLANSNACAFGPVSGGISFYYQDMEELWRVWRTGETLYDIEPSKLANVEHDVLPGIQMFRIEETQMYNRLEQERLSHKFIPLDILVHSAVP